MRLDIQCQAFKCWCSTFSQVVCSLLESYKYSSPQDGRRPLCRDRPGAAFFLCLMSCSVSKHETDFQGQDRPHQDRYIHQSIHPKSVKPSIRKSVHPYSRKSVNPQILPSVHRSTTRGCLGHALPRARPLQTYASFHIWERLLVLAGCQAGSKLGYFCWRPVCDDICTRSWDKLKTASFCS